MSDTPQDQIPTVRSQTATAEGVVTGEKPGDFIGPYKLLQIIGEGGFGIVWLAERREPMVQRVALKVIKPGMDSKAVIARFEQERQALAVMDHPNVAKVFDGGITPAGRPYFVMEHVAGEPITDYCDRQRLTIRQRLELFIPVCEAVQHAHMKGIIHRDIKPSNILVSVREGNAAPKVIDFGVAKAISHTLTEKTIFTEQGVLIGTPEYMSPEQAEMGATDIDTRTDVYSLGVVLYELLSGLLPFDPQALRSAGYAEIQRLIREVEPPKPSMRLSTTDEKQLTAIAHQRQAVRRRIMAEFKRELDWIPLMAMRKDRTRRYATAHELAEDVKRYLSSQTLKAGPETLAYRVRKFVSCHKAMIGVLVGAAIFTIALGVVDSRWKLERERAQRTEVRLATKSLRAAEESVRNETWDLALAHLTLADDVRHSLDHALAHTLRAEVYLQLDEVESALDSIQEAERYTALWKSGDRLPRYEFGVPELDRRIRQLDETRLAQVVRRSLELRAAIHARHGEYREALHFFDQVDAGIHSSTYASLRADLLVRLEIVDDAGEVLAEWYGNAPELSLHERHHKARIALQLTEIADDRGHSEAAEHWRAEITRLLRPGPGRWPTRRERSTGDGG